MSCVCTFCGEMELRFGGHCFIKKNGDIHRCVEENKYWFLKNIERFLTNNSGLKTRRLSV